MLYWLDTEFIENGKTIDLLSIGVVAEDGREYYAINYECDRAKANDWVKKNVLPCIPAEPPPQYYGTYKKFQASEPYKQGWRNKSLIAQELEKFLRVGGIPEIWGEWSSYDWVAFCQIFGAMADLPADFPKRPRDIIQWAEDHLGIPASQLPSSLETVGNHHALLGAKTVKTRYYWLKKKQTIVDQNSFKFEAKFK